MNLKPGTWNLVFIHGAGSSGDFWYEQRLAFPGAHYLDLPGHGSAQGETSDLLEPDKHDIETYAEAVSSYTERARLDGVILNGHSMGGAVALTLALRRPAWLRGLILTGTGPRLKVSSYLLELLRTDYPAAVERIIDLSFAPVQGVKTYRQRIMRNGTRRKLMRLPQRVTLADYEACDGFDVAPLLVEIEVPTLIVVGTDDRVTPPELSQELHAGISGSILCLVEGAGHMLPLEKPAEYNEAVRRFTAEVVDSSVRGKR